MTIENHIALPIPPDPYDDMEPERIEVCCVCNRTGYLVRDSRWYEATCIDTDEDGAHLMGRGRPLYDAADTASGWVCSRRCRSQAMYDRIKDDCDKEALKDVHEACKTLIEYGKSAILLVNREMDETLDYELVQRANKFLEEIGDDEGGSPDWCVE
jgi:hypothetical protein